jgi:hypothetical protein
MCRRATALIAMASCHLISKMGHDLLETAISM